MRIGIHADIYYVYNIIIIYIVGINTAPHETIVYAVDIMMFLRARRVFQKKKQNKTKHYSRIIFIVKPRKLIIYIRIRNVIYLFYATHARRCGCTNVIAADIA